jgi:cytochrome c peroxidase
MPAHNHGFPTEPRVTKHVGFGTYLIEGIKFNMAGWWEFVFDIRAGSVTDRARFNVVVEVESDWTKAELRTLRSLSLQALRPPPGDPTNKHADDPQAALFGARLFFDARLSGTGEISCASCHKPSRQFTDGRARGRGVGETRRHVPTLIGVAYSPWLYWDGRRDSAWSQALAPLEGAAEMGGSRIRVLRAVSADPGYRSSYQAIFGQPLPDLSDEKRFPPEARPTGGPAERHAWEAMAAEDRAAVDRAFTNLGKALAAYERKLLPGPSRFDGWVDAMTSGKPEPKEPLSDDERAGIRLFIAPTSQCLRCHNGPLFTNHGFHNIGLSQPAGAQSDFGRQGAIDEVLRHEFNCRSPYSDARESQCLELRFIKREGVELPGAFKVPTLRNVARTAPYMHTGQFDTLDQVLQHYSQPGVGIGHQELAPANFDEVARRQLAAFLGTLSSDVADPRWLVPPR